MIVAYYSDKYKIRYPFIIGPALVTLTGLCLTAFAHNNKVRYFGVSNYFIYINDGTQTYNQAPS
jgi:hypothetical protein